MKKILACILIAPLIWLACTSFTTNNTDKYLRKKGFVLVPSGSVTLMGKAVSIQSFYILQSEVTNKEYNTFLNEMLANGDSAHYQSAKIFSEKWRLPNSSMEAFVQNYSSNPIYDNYPVVNIKQEGAQLYCQWLEQQLKEQGILVKVRLPTEAEWKYAAKGGNDANIYAWEGTELRNKKGVYLANYKTEKQSDDGTYITAVTKSYFPNGFDIYNMCGNVSEWISDPAMSEGGNWHSDPIYLRIDAAQEFGNSTDASPFIGFRPVITRAWE